MRTRGHFHKRFKLTELVFVVLLAISGVRLGLSSGGFLVDFNKVGFTIFSSIEKGVNTVFTGVKDFFTAVQKTATLQKEYKELTEKLKDYEFLQRNNTEIRKENERLKEQLEFKETLTSKNYVAQIIARDPDGLYSGITINKGSRHGIKKGMPVIAVQHGSVGVVGKIVTVGLGTSMIMPVYDLQCNISARIQNTRDIGIVSGNGTQESNLVMKYIKKRVLDELSYGDIVVTSGENNNYMRDIPIGTISKITVLDYDSSLSIELNPIIDFSRLETVIVIDQEEVLND